MNAPVTFIVGTIPLKRARQSMGLTQAELARMAGVTAGAICNIENNHQGRFVRTSYDTAYALSKALGLAINMIKWPCGLTSRGRPIGSKNVKVRTEADGESAICQTCFLVLPATQRCDSCS